ncbi:NAD kinase [Apibacter muscae]|uniref:NAD kinase n=1 Tax=Apibacter muscae TaxID=2509004 RepID=A0A563D903_9FLAO|nr:NAD kinase [Apibacter muscae]TWP26666.1 NAD kinase [Apibacter muscae]
MKVGIYGQVVKEEDKDLLKTFFNELETRGIEVYIYELYKQELQKILGYENPNFQTLSKRKKLPKDLQLLFTFGGDGTILSTISIIKDLKIPIVGVNTGRLGFLATLQKTEVLRELPRILEGNYEISERSVLEIKSLSGNVNSYAINEVAVIRNETTSMINIDAYVNEVFLNTFWADGLIVSTPTGSTGYSLSCGGPIIYPKAEIVVLTPIAPHNLNVRPLILQDNIQIKLKVNSRSDIYFMSLDSRYYKMNIEDEILISKANFKINIVNYKDYSYYQNLRDKLQWGVDSRN